MIITIYCAVFVGDAVDLVRPQMMGVRQAEAGPLDPSRNGLAVRPEVVRRGGAGRNQN